MPALTRGSLLVANPLLPDDNFHRTVVWLLAHGEEGAIGVVLNRPSETGLDEVLGGWAAFASSPAVVFVGGPVNPDAVIGVARLPHGVPARLREDGEGWSRVVNDVGTLDLELDPQEVGGGVEALRMFAGYAGWSAGQLEGEIEAGAWWVLDAVADDVFAPDPDRLWTRVLRRQHGSLQLVSSFPEDPSAN